MTALTLRGWQFHVDLLDPLSGTLSASETATVARGLSILSDRDSRVDALITLAQAEEDLLADGLRDVLAATVMRITPRLEDDRRDALWKVLAETEVLLSTWQQPDAGGLFVDPPPTGCTVEATVRATVDRLIDRREATLTLLLGGRP